MHTILRILLEPYRADFRGDGSGWTMTGVIAGVQMIGGMFLALQTDPGWKDVGGCLEWCQAVWSDVVMCGWVLFWFASLIYGYNYQRIGRWVK